MKGPDLNHICDDPSMARQGTSQTLKNKSNLLLKSGPNCQEKMYRKLIDGYRKHLLELLAPLLEY